MICRDSRYNSCHGNGFNIFQSDTFLGFHSSNPYMDLHQIINIYILQKHLQLIIFCTDCQQYKCHGIISGIFPSLSFCNWLCFVEFPGTPVAMATVQILPWQHSWNFLILHFLQLIIFCTDSSFNFCTSESALRLRVCFLQRLSTIKV